MNTDVDAQITMSMADQQEDALVVLEREMKR